MLDLLPVFKKHIPLFQLEQFRVGEQKGAIWVRELRQNCIILHLEHEKLPCCLSLMNVHLHWSTYRGPQCLAIIKFMKVIRFCEEAQHI